MPPKHSADSSGVQPVQLGENSQSAGIVESARGRSDGFEVGADRAITNPPNWESAQSSQELWDQANLGNDPGTAETLSHGWSAHGTQLSQASNDLYNAISELGSAWVGQGAAGAQGALVAIANSSSQASEAASTMSDRLQKQADAATKVKLMPKPTNYSPEAAMGQALAGGPVAMVTDQKPLADQDKEVRAEQARFLEAYTKEMSEVDGSTPSFGPESLGMKPTATHNSASFSGVGNVGNANLGSGGVSGTSGLPGTHGLAGVAPGSAAALHGGPDSGVFSQAGYAQGATGAAPGMATGAGVGSGAGAAPITPPSAPGGGGNALGQALGMGALGGGLGYAGAKALGQGNKSGAAKDTDSTESAATENAPAQSAASQAVPQQGIVNSSGTIGAGAPPPMQGMGGMGGGMGAHGAQAEQEEEHTHASFLIEPDPDDAFGANEATPPPVIGAWTDDDER